MVEEHKLTVFLAQQFLGDTAFSTERIRIFGPKSYLLLSLVTYGISKMSAASLLVIFGSNPPL
jgi:hypothetical protein